MAKTSEFTDAVRNIVAEADVLRQAGAKSRAIPPMQERVSSREARSRVKHLTTQDLTLMTAESRAALVKAVGTQAVLDVIRRGRDDASS